MTEQTAECERLHQRLHDEGLAHPVAVLAVPAGIRLGRQQPHLHDGGDELMTYEQRLATRALWDIERQILLEDEEGEMA